MLSKTVANLLVVAIPVSKPNRNVPMAANKAIPKVYHIPMLINYLSDRLEESELNRLRRDVE
jgi:hypothetical protein